MKNCLAPHGLGPVHPVHPSTCDMTVPPSRTWCKVHTSRHALPASPTGGPPIRDETLGGIPLGKKP
eukprot:9494068-Ditylum_brightwellii.AAC.1